MRRDPKKIARGSVRRSRDIPTTGDGFTHRQKPKMKETNLGKQGWLAPLIRRVTGGKHQGK